jgi:hypothetical protein
MCSCMQHELMTGSIKQIKAIVSLVRCCLISMLILLTKLMTTGLIGSLYFQGQLLSKLFVLKLQHVSYNNFNTIFTLDFASTV